jgi:transcriptional regulator with XRE-family HTH domain
MLTAAQIRAARALLDWKQPRLAQESGVSEPTIRRMEGAKGPGKSSAENVEAVRRALEDAGIIFLADGELRDGGPGVRLREPEAT